MDFSLLRNALKLALLERHFGHEPLEKALDSLKQSMSPFNHNALQRESEGATDIFRRAGISNFQDRLATPILARALLTLQLAAATTASPLEEAGVSKSGLEFWWSPMGTELGLWDAAV